MNLNIKDKQIVSDKEVNTSNGIVYDFGEENTSGNVPIEKILDQVISILEYMNTPELKTLKETNYPLYEQTIEDKYPDFSYNYYSVFKMVISGEDITPLFKMLEVLGDVRAGKTSFEDGEKNVGQYLTKFLPDGLLDKLENGELGVNDIKTPNKKKNKKNKKKH
ncbi:hypothetical protein QKU48_gp0300 [Fadolivirus algeromassiliense]|jgi:hypothetical protein|uniref:Uncharacterized protein n=1 Tax=Fadolivirus FV1/VV64 TaxID=3070911 RepID=A0A7D3R1F0_9VIRU|nr:hypothetical protein QKU48_gp0300 [Fadolivirus algeromassiliense]QKF93758.1 hypothetical protein Fadolivirus_1_300 [Fadolivirus FV1/VV64]